MYAFSNDSAMIFNLNIMLPDVVIQPSLGYVMAIQRCTSRKLSAFWTRSI
jgi:hypothetical protein